MSNPFNRALRHCAMIAVLMLALALLCGLAACAPTASSDASTTETESNSESGSDNATLTDSESEVEPEETETRFDFTAVTIEDYVQLDPSAYEHMEVTLSSELKVTQESIDAFILKQRVHHRKADQGSEVVKDVALTLGDDAYIYYRGYLDGVLFDGGSNWDAKEPTRLALGSGSFIPGFEEGLLGVVPSQTSKEAPLKLHVTFPDLYSPAMAGKEAVFEVWVVESVRYTPAEYTRSFVLDTLMYEPKQEFYASDRALLTEFEAYVRDYLESSMAGTLEDSKASLMWDQLIRAATFKKLPEEEVARYLRSSKKTIEDYWKYAQKQYDSIDEMAVDYLGLEPGADWEAYLAEKAVQYTQQDALCYLIAKQEGVVVTEKEFNESVEYWINYYGQSYGSVISSEEVIKLLGEDNIRHSALCEKVQNLLMERVHATFKGDAA